MTDPRDVPWDDHQQWEQAWWGTCHHTYGEETKQLTYAHRMGLINLPVVETWPVYHMQGKSVCDLGGGPISLLLKSVDAWGTVVDPCVYPHWVMERYAIANITYVREKAETFDVGRFDEVWMYNLLQHTENPKAICANARKIGRLVRIFDWIETGPAMGHPQTLHAAELDEWFGGEGSTENMNENGCYGLAYYGTFAGDA